MSTSQARLEARVSVQERRQLNLETRIEELATDLNGCIGQLSIYLMRKEEETNSRFDKIEATMVTKDDLAAFAVQYNLANMATKDDLAAFATKDDLAAFATKDDLAAFATKDDLAAMENQVLDAFKQLLAMVDSRLPSPI
jgi:hypothetical protein